MRIKLRYLYLALMDQMPIHRAYHNFFITGNAWGIFSIYSHQRKDGKEKVGYNTRKSAEKAAESMQKKYDGVFRPYRCAFCGKFHIGKNRVIKK